MNPANITRMLGELCGGNRQVVDDLAPLVYQELKRIAGGQLRGERPGHTLQATALVHEAYLKLVDQREATFQNRAHFFGVAAQMMRRILLDSAKSRRREKRGGGRARATFDEGALPAPDAASDVIEIDEALIRLEQLDARQAKIVELRFYGGLTVEETAEALGISAPTVKREWAMARAWLRRKLESA